MKKLLFVLVLLAVVAASVGAYYVRGRADEELRFSYLSVSRGDIVESVGATGTLQPVRTVMVGSQVSGNIKTLYADFNTIVREGQVVAELDPSLFETQVAQAKANLTRSEADRDRQRLAVDDAVRKLDRTRSLFERQIAARQDLETAEVGVKSAQAALKSAEAAVLQAQASVRQAEVSLEQTVIRSPADGIVTSRNVDVGQTVAARLNAPTIFVIAGDLTTMQVVANVDESDVGRIRPGQVVRFRVDAYPNDDFIGAVSQVRLNPIVAQNVVTYATVIDVPNPELKLKVGMTANATIEVARRANVLRVPNGALRYRPGPDIFAELRQPLPPELQRAATGRAMASGTPAAGLAAGDAPPAGVKAPGDAESQVARSVAAMADGKPGVRMIDHLFAAPPPVTTTGRAWINAGGQLKSVGVRLGISDGTWTELLSGEVREGQALVSNIVTPAMAAASARRPSGQPGGQQPARSPFQGGGGGHGGGPH